MTLFNLKLNSTYLIQPFFNACFYGLKSIFVLYIISHLSLTEAQAVGIYSTLMALCYATTLAGGYIAQQGLGVRNAITAGGVLSILGLGCALFPSEDLYFLGLSLVSLGSGLFKPNLLAAIGLTFENPRDPLKDKAYSVVYVMGNAGIFLLTALCGFVGKHYGWTYGILLVMGLFTVGTYLSHKVMRFHPSHEENQVPAISQSKLWGGIGFLVILLYFLFKYRDSFHGMMGFIACGSLVYLVKIVYQCTSEERKGVLTVLAYIFLFSLFVTLFEQAGSSLLLFLEKAVDRNVLGSTIPSSTLLSLGAVYVLVCSPVLFYITGKLEKKGPLSEFTKPGFAFLFAAFSFWVLTWGIAQESGALIPLFWVIGAIALQTFGELWVAPISLSKVSQHSPIRLQSILMSFWTMAIAYGHYFAGMVAQFSLAATPEQSLGQYQAFFSGLGIAALVVGGVVLVGQKAWQWRHGQRR